MKHHPDCIHNSGAVPPSFPCPCVEIERLEKMLDVCSVVHEHNVKLKGRLDRIGALLSEHGCDCECECDSEGHDQHCERCLACRIEEVLIEAKVKP